MRSRAFDPSHLDVRSFAEQAATLEGKIPVCDFTRLVETTHPESRPAAEEWIRWQARGQLRTVPGEGKQAWLILRAEAVVRLTCQRCLQAVEYPLEVDQQYRFVTDEATAAAIDIEAEEDVLVESRSFDLRTLIEEELLLALPIVPRHEGACPRPLHALADPLAATIESAPRDKPFAVLARLKSRKSES